MEISYRQRWTRWRKHGAEGEDESFSKHRTEVNKELYSVLSETYENENVGSNDC